MTRVMSKLLNQPLSWLPRRTMNRSLAHASALALLLTASVTVCAIDPLEFRDSAEEARFQTLAKELRCLVCQNESLADSRAGLAQDLRRDVIEQIRNGSSDEEIKRYLTDRYGDFILYRPPVKPVTWLLWFGPALMFLVAGFVLFRILRRNRPTTGEDPAAVSGDW
ncbi:MAG: cytochrome c-type biogenesis protein CcmH [Lysobacteraceae bacterium]|nr:MAG: cytochrome c-type biogenesis protein CcmH [Xanthomonadaceae bacterium]